MEELGTKSLVAVLVVVLTITDSGRVTILLLVISVNYLSLFLHLSRVFASTGKDIVINSTDSDPAMFFISLPSKDSSILSFLANPYNEEVFHLTDNNNFSISSRYKNRIVNLKFENWSITFGLRNVTRKDEGFYSCRQGGPKGPEIPNCGQTLRYIGKPDAGAVPPGQRSASIIVHCRGDHRPAYFNISMPPSSLSLTILIVHPSGKTFITREKQYFPRRETEFAHRIHSLERQGDSISFSLINVDPADAGEYVCREDSLTGRLIRGCGQRLHYIDLERPHVRHSRLPVDGEELELSCEVYVPDQAAELGLHFSFHWSRDGQPLSGQHDRVLAFRPVCWRDRGLYSCCVLENSRDCGSSPESNAFSLTPVVTPTVSLRRHEHHSHIEVEAGLHMTLTCAVKVAFPPVPPNGFTWIFSQSDSSPARQLSLTGDTLTLGPVTREDSGQYTCQARNDQDTGHQWRHGEDSVTVTVTDTKSFQLPPDGRSEKEQAPLPAFPPVPDWPPRPVSYNRLVEEQATGGPSKGIKNAAPAKVDTIAVWAIVCLTWTACVAVLD